jgi:hypothetical protein
MGVACIESHGTIAAACATVTVSRRGRLNIEKMLVVLDAGRVINPHAATEQCEGSVCWELSHAWMGGLELEGGRFVNTNFDTYNLLRIDQVAQVETIFASSGGKKWGGLGEPAGPPAPPAVANAIYYATGKRIRSTPFRSHDLTWTQSDLGAGWPRGFGVASGRDRSQVEPLRIVARVGGGPADAGPCRAPHPQLSFEGAPCLDAIKSRGRPGAKLDFRQALRVTQGRKEGL